MAGHGGPAGRTELSVLAQRAADALQARLKRSPALNELPNAIDAIARAIASLASPDGKLSVLARWQNADLLAGTGLQLQQTEAAFDEQWLTLAAPVRPPLARFEALQLEAGTLGAFAPLVAWTSSPGDPWRTGENAAVKRNSDQRAKVKPRAYDLSPFVVAYGSADSWAGTEGGRAVGCVWRSGAHETAHDHGRVRVQRAGVARAPGDPAGCAARSAPATGQQPAAADYSRDARTGAGARRPNGRPRRAANAHAEHVAANIRLPRRHTWSGRPVFE